MIKKLLFFPLLVSATMLAAQHNHATCGTSLLDQMMDEERLLANIAAAKNNQTNADNGAITYLPVQFHLVANSQSTGRGRVVSVLDALCTLNNDFAEHEIQFYLSPHPVYGLITTSINHDNVYQNQDNAFLMNNRKNQNAINIYIVNYADTDGGGDGVLAYYSPLRDWIVCEKPYLRLGESTLSHEMGHFLSLRHTFYGWEPGCFNTQSAGWPNAPVTSPGGAPTERQNGSNGTTAADLFSDTPPDYNFGFCDVTNNCAPYTLGAKDPLGTLVNPMENNFMGYYFNCADFVFTEQQEAAMKADIASNGRNYLDNNFSPVASTIAVPSNLLVSPTAGQVLTTPTTANLSWNSVTGATWYLVEVDRLAVFSTGAYTSYLTQDTNLPITDLLANKTYYWRVRPFNEFYACAPATTSSFVSGPVSSTDDIQQINGWTLSPNPTESNTPVVLQVDASSGFDVQIRIFDAVGRQVANQLSVSVKSGANTIELPTQNLSNGSYTVSLVNNKGVESKQLVIIR